MNHFRYSRSTSAFWCFVVIKLVTSTSNPNNDIGDDMVTINNNTYSRHILSNLSGSPYDLAINERTGSLYFAQNDDLDNLDVYVLKKNDKEPLKIIIGATAQTIAVDNLKGKVYIGADDGIYEFDEGSGKSTRIALVGRDVWQLFIPRNRNELYFTEYTDRILYKMMDQYEETSFDKFGRGENFIIDNDSNAYYICSKKYPHVYLNGYTKSIRYEGLSGNDELLVLSIDKHDDVFASNNKNIFLLNKYSQIPKLVGNVGFTVSAFLFDNNDNIILGTNGTLFKYRRV